MENLCLLGIGPGSRSVRLGGLMLVLESERTLDVEQGQKKSRCVRSPCIHDLCQLGRLQPY